jgi:hypothetical protein
MSAGLPGWPARGVVCLRASLAGDAMACCSAPGFSGGQISPSHAQGWGRWRLCQVGGPRGRAA